MIMIHNKDFETLVKETDLELLKNGFTISPGGIAKLFKDIINKHLADFYETLEINHVQAFVTTATGIYLDSIGLLLNCIRKEDETDNDFRNRICSQTLSLAKANETSIRLAALECEHVDDVVLKKYSHGPGSFTIIPISNNDYESALTEVEQALIGTVSFGEKVVVKTPILKRVKININILYGINANENARQEVSLKVRESVIKYINSLKVGETLVINELTQRVMSCSNQIVNYSCDVFKINEKECLLINQSCRWDEKMTISEDIDSVTVK